MRTKLCYLVSVVMLCLSTSVFALTDAEIEARLDEYAAKIKQLEAELAKAKKAKSPVYVQDLERSIKRVEKKLDKKEDSDLQINGFITAAVTQSDRDLERFGYDKTPNFRGLSKAGLQLSYQLNEKADATIQMVARSEDDGEDVWEMNAEWAYLGYQITDNLKVRAGRLRIPFYMFSESLDVGYTYPWARLPLEVYRSPITAYEGLNLMYNFNTGEFNNRLQFWLSSSSDTSNFLSTDLDIVLKDSYGGNLTSSWGDYTFRAMYYTVTVDGESEVAVSTAPVVLAMFPAEDDLDYAALGFQWDNGEYFVITETTDFKTQDGLFFTDEKAGYISAGMRIDDWTPFAKYGWQHSANEGDFVAKGSTVCVSALNATGAVAALDNKTCSSQSKSFGLGARKELGSNLSVTFQWDHYYDLDDTNGLFDFDGYELSFTPPGTVNALPGEKWDNFNTFTLSLDAVY